MPAWLLIAIASLVLTVDQVSKSMIQSHFGLGESHHLLGRWVRLSYCHNTGGAFSLLTGHTGFFLFVGVAVTLMLFFSLPKIAKLPAVTAGAYALILGGAIGNLCDRFRFGFVVDFIDFGRDANWWPVFNLADSAITVGIVLLGWAVFTGRDTFPGDSSTVVAAPPPVPMA
jgi:signal peptidase II